VIVVAQDSAVADAWRTLRDNRIRQAPVVDDQRKLIGLVSERGLLTAIDVEDGQVIAARRRKVRGVMTTPVVAAAPITDIRRIASVMLARGWMACQSSRRRGGSWDSFPGATSCAQWLPIRP
jgi:CBS domain-containing protein